MKMTYVLLVLALCAGAGGCASRVLFFPYGVPFCRGTNDAARPVSLPHEPEIVMTEGMEITATTETGTIVILAGKGFKRTYTWEGCTRSETLEPRCQRWNGSLGIHSGGLGDHWPKCRGISRGVLNEGQQHFDTIEEALTWLRSRRRPGYDWVCRDDGLVVGWGKVLDRNQLNVDVWQIYINGQKPTQLPGSDISRISVTHRR